MAGIFLIDQPMAVFAQEENDTTPTTTEKLKERIEKIVEQRKDKIDQVLGDISTQRKGFVGQILRISETTFTLDVNGTTRIVPFDETVQLLKNDQEIKPENISVDDWAIVMGLLEDDSINPKKIEITSDSPLPDTIFVELGSLKDIKTKSVDFQSRYEESTKTIIVNTKTRVEDYEGEEADYDQLIEEDQVLIVGYTDEDDTYATTIRALAPFVKE